MLRMEADLQDYEARMVRDVRGLNSKYFTKQFANQRAMERWLESETADDYEVYEIIRAE